MAGLMVEAMAALWAACLVEKTAASTDDWTVAWLAGQSACLKAVRTVVLLAWKTVVLKVELMAVVLVGQMAGEKDGPMVAPLAWNLVVLKAGLKVASSAVRLARKLVGLKAEKMAVSRVA